MPHLKIRADGKETLHAIEGDSVTLGRSDQNDVDLPDPVASKEHCRLECQGDRWKLIDLESKNGTLVDGAFRNKAWLEQGTKIRIGHTEILFHVGAASAPGKRNASLPAVPASRRRAEPEEGEGGEAPPAPPPRSNEKLVKAGATVLVSVIALAILIWIMQGAVGDTWNDRVLAEAAKLEAAGQLNEAEAYLRQHGDPKGKLFPRVEERIRQIRIAKPVFYKSRLEEQANPILALITRKIWNYNLGADTDPQEILRLIERLKTEFAGTDVTDMARKSYPQWFEGKAPPRGDDAGRPGGWVRADFDKALARARDYEKSWNFREARETVQSFLASREAALSPADLDLYRKEVQENVRRIEMLADSVFRGQEQEVTRLLKNKRYDQAIAIYTRIRDSFGIDTYVRKAQAGIDSIKAEQSAGGAGK